MLIGEHVHTIDEKKRVSLPAKMRKELGETVVLCRGLDTCIFLYTKSEWEKFVSKLSELSIGKPESRSFARFIIGGAVETSVDSSGRILIPDHLKEFAHIAEQSLMVIGMVNRLELWSQNVWNNYREGVIKNSVEHAALLGEIGMI
ncbi:MAG TPA: division/cell wall cluster transcriptional repressor MraZ [Candidatus Paceibacterota bacterium]